MREKKRVIKTEEIECVCECQKERDRVRDGEATTVSEKGYNVRGKDGPR